MTFWYYNTKDIYIDAMRQTDQKSAGAEPNFETKKKSRDYYILRISNYETMKLLVCHLKERSLLDK